MYLSLNAKVFPTVTFKHLTFKVIHECQVFVDVARARKKQKVLTKQKKYINKSVVCSYA